MNIDKAVEAAAKAIYTCPPGRRLEPWDTLTGKLREEYLRAGRAALEAAAPRPVIDREAVTRIIGDVRALPCTRSATPHIDAVMELARPMPTREQIEQALQECGIGSYRTIVTDAVLALLNGSES